MTPLISRVLAPNPGPYTGPGTNTYVVSDGGAAVVIDPGPVIDGHLVAIERAIGDDAVVAVVVTHTHPDHAPAANPLGRRWSVPVLGFASGPSFRPTDLLADGDAIHFGAAQLIAVHTPGHTADSLCFVLGQVLFTGDHIMGGSTVIIEDAAAYMRSLHRVSSLAPDIIHPGHGERIDDGPAIVDAYIAHRKERERQLVAAITAGAAEVADIVEVVYAGIDAALRPAAEQQVQVQIDKLVAEERVFLVDGALSAEPKVAQ